MISFNGARSGSSTAGFTAGVVEVQVFAHYAAEILAKWRRLPATPTGIGRISRLKQSSNANDNSFARFHPELCLHNLAYIISRLICHTAFFVDRYCRSDTHDFVKFNAQSIHLHPRMYYCIQNKYDIIRSGKQLYESRMRATWINVTIQAIVSTAPRGKEWISRTPAHIHALATQCTHWAMLKLCSHICEQISWINLPAIYWLCKCEEYFEQTLWWDKLSAHTEWVCVCVCERIPSECE